MKAYVLLAVALVACEPSVSDRSYYCGANRSCPPGQQCDDPAYTCDDPARVRPFACPAEDLEPNDQEDTAIDLGATACGDLLVSQKAGCLSEGTDVDVYSFSHAELCALRNDAIVATNFPAAFAPMKLEVKDSAGTVVATGEPCTPANDTSGRTRLCAEFELSAGDYYVYTSVVTGEGSDCDGGCRYNEYELDIALPP